MILSQQHWISALFSNPMRYTVHFSHGRYHHHGRSLMLIGSSLSKSLGKSVQSFALWSERDSPFDIGHR